MFSPDGTLISASAAPHCGVVGEGGTSEAVADLFSRISEFISVWGDGHVSPLQAKPAVSPEKLASWLVL